MAYGAPDWTAARFQIKPTIGSNQERYLFTAAGAIDAGGTGTLDITVPAGDIMTFSKITADSPVSCIQEVDISINDTIYFRQYYDIHGEIKFSVDDALVLSAGVKLTVTVVNNYTSTQTMRISLAGGIESV